MWEVTTHFSTESGTHPGKLVAAGNCNNHFCLVRWNADGSLDDGGPNDSTPGDGAFGAAGIVVSTFTSVDDGRALLVQPDGKLVVAGGCGSTKSFCVARYNVNGSLDDGTVNDSTPGDAFGGVGHVITNVAPGPETALAIARQPVDGKLILAGLCDNNSASDVCLVRYNVDGSLDSGAGNDSTPSDSFGVGGQVITNIGGVDVPGALALQTDGRIIVAGSTDSKSFVARYNIDGSLDDGGAGDATPGDSFGSGGKVLTDATPGNEGYSGLVIQPSDGKIVAAGACGDASFTFTLCVARYTTGGTLDGTFGPGGLVTTPFFAKKNALAAGVVLLSDERIVAAGRTLSPGRQNDFALTRYFGNALVTPTPSVTPTVTKTASRTPTPHATATMTSGGGTPTSATATVTPVGPSATPTPVPTRTPAAEVCDDCIDNDFDGAVDRADSDCPPPANGNGAGLGDPAAKPAVACEKAIAKAGTTFALKRVKGLGTCLQSAFACVEQKASDPACLAKAGAACTKADSARQTAASKLTKSILAKCNAPALAPADLIAPVGLGFMDEQSGCMGFGVPLLQNATDVATCTAGRHACRAEALLGTALPRARELLTLAGHDPAVEAPCLPPGGSGGASANGKGVVKCQKGVASAGAAYGGVRLGARQKCVAAVLGCVQLKPGDAPCLAKAGATCSKLDTRIAAASAKLTAAIAKACGSPLALSDLVDPPGVGFGLRGGLCQALGIPALDSTDAVAACLKAESDCRIGQLLEGQTPRAGELSTLPP